MGKLEIEIRITNKDININTFKKKIKEIGAVRQQKEVVFYYMNYYHPLKKQMSIRVRNEGSYTSLTVKTKKNKNDKYPMEYEVNVSDYKETNNILKLLGCTENYGMQKLREVWSFNNCKEIVFDTYPGAETFVEIECNDEKAIKNILKKVGLSTNLNDYKGLQMDKYYLNEYGIKPRKQYNGLTFLNAQKELLSRATKNKKLFIKRLTIQIKKHNKQLQELK